MKCVLSSGVGTAQCSDPFVYTFHLGWNVCMIMDFSYVVCMWVTAQYVFL